MRVLQKALTFDDVLLVPAHSAILPREVSLSTQLTRTITLNLPLLSAAMDTVTEARLAIALAQEGGIGIIHKNMSAEMQAAQVTAVKRFESGVVKDPITVAPQMTVRQVLEITRAKRISGLPVIDGGKVVGIVTNRDLRFETQLDQTIAKIMTPKERLVTVKEGAGRDEALALLHKHRLERVLPFVDSVIYLPDASAGNGGAVLFDDPRAVMQHIDLTPPLVSVGKALGWQPLPLTIKEGLRYSRPWLAEHRRMADESPRHRRRTL